jgi:hypothetical protein
MSILGDLSSDFDFTQAPRAPLILPAAPLASIVPSLVVHSTRMARVARVAARAVVRP